MARGGLKGMPGNRRRWARHETPTASDLVERNFTRNAPNALWVTEITEHRAREGKVLGAKPSTGSVGDSYDNALAEAVNGLFKTEPIRRRGPWRTVEQVELATLE